MSDYGIVVDYIRNGGSERDGVKAVLALDRLEARVKELEELLNIAEGAIQRTAEDCADDNDRLREALEQAADFMETSAATAARRDEPEMARILSNASHKLRRALEEREQ